MRIITGKFKGRRISTVQDNRVRPATDRVKGSIFNSLQNRIDLSDARVLDLFAGSGNLGFEALSRGAAEIVFVDSSREILNTIKQNAQELNCIAQCNIIHDDALNFVKHQREKYDLIFADPPYAYSQSAELVELIFSNKLLKNEGILIVEHSKQTILESTELHEIVSQKEFGNTLVTFFTYKSQ
jgi:16S rRNA (guanine966-N2)-methyltransferase